MQNGLSKRQLFNDKKDSATPVTLTSVGTGSNRLRFFNSSRGSTMEDAAAIDFKPGQLQHSQLFDSKDVTKDTFTIRGKLKWIKEQEPIERKNGTHTVVRDAVIADGTHSIEISTWGDLISAVQENVLYEMTQITVRNYFGQRLATSPGTVARAVPDDDNTITINYQLRYRASKTRFK